MTTIFEAKWWIASRTMGFNLLCALFAILPMILPLFEVAVPLQWYSVLTTISVVGNTILRVLTQIKLTAK